MNKFLAIALALCAAGATGAKPAPTGAPPAADAPPKLQQLMQSCDAHKFETVVDTTEDGKPHKSRVKLCGVEGQSDSDWIGTLKDAIAKLDSNKDMDPAVRNQIVTAIRGEITRIQGKLSSGESATAFNLAPGPTRLQALIFHQHGQWLWPKRRCRMIIPHCHRFRPRRPRRHTYSPPPQR